MRDSIIKNTGNSRYLKSAISAATTWEQFRAALIAGTLPIDLNGINTAGWQQVGDALNKANLLSDATVAALNAFLTRALPSNPKVTDALKSLATGGLGRIAYGSYIGTGTYGANNPCSLTFPFSPQIVMITIHEINSASSQPLISGPWIRGMSNGRLIVQPVAYSNNNYVNLTWNGNALSFYSTKDANYQLNLKDGIYYFFAIG